MEQQLNQNRDLTDELRRSKLENTNLHRSLNDSQLLNREKDRLQDMVTELEVCFVSLFFSKLIIDHLERSSESSCSK